MTLHVGRAGSHYGDLFATDRASVCPDSAAQSDGKETDIRAPASRLTHCRRSQTGGESALTCCKYLVFKPSAHGVYQNHLEGQRSAQRPLLVEVGKGGPESRPVPSGDSEPHRSVRTTDLSLDHRVSKFSVYMTHLWILFNYRLIQQACSEASEPAALMGSQVMLI